MRRPLQIRRNPLHLTLAVIALVLPGQLASAQGLPIMPEAERPEWAAVGRVNAAGYRQRSMCSGTLVEPDLVLTAAHCLFRQGGGRVAMDDLVFVAGWDRGEAVADRGVKAVALHPKAILDGKIDARFDMALLRLNAPISEAMPIQVVAAPRPGALSLVAYQTSRPHALGGAFDCAVAEDFAAPFITDCLVEHGSSGGPALVETPEGWRVIGVISAISNGKTVIAPTSGWQEQ